MIIIETVKFDTVITENHIKEVLKKLSEADNDISNTLWLDVKELGYKSNLDYLFDITFKDFESNKYFYKEDILKALQIFYYEISKHSFYELDFNIKIIGNTLIVALYME